MKRVLAGPRSVLEAVKADPGRLQVVYVGDSVGRDAAEAAARARAAKVIVEERPTVALDALAKGLRHQGILALAGDFPYRSLEEVLQAAAPPAALVLCDGIEDPQNLGAILRASVFFGASGVVVPKHRAAPVTGAAVRSSAGAS